MTYRRLYLFFHYLCKAPLSLSPGFLGGVWTPPKGGGGGLQNLLGSPFRKPRAEILPFWLYLNSCSIYMFGI